MKKKDKAEKKTVNRRVKDLERVVFSQASQNALLINKINIHESKIDSCIQTIMKTARMIKIMHESLKPLYELTKQFEKIDNASGISQIIENLKLPQEAREDIDPIKTDNWREMDDVDKELDLVSSELDVPENLVEDN